MEIEDFDTARISALAAEVVRALSRNGHMLVTAESCTGGWIAKAITDIPGSSAVLDRGYVTYTNAAKHEMLGVATATLERFGAVSEPVVAEMAQGALRRSHAAIAVAVSGIAGPGGGSIEKPVGTVCLAWAIGRDTEAETVHLEGDRSAVRGQTVLHALSGLIERAPRLAQAGATRPR
ncbi:MAG: CinA family protein [Thiotrichales bacterium]